MKPKEMITSSLADAGITVNGEKAYDIQVHNEQFYNKVYKHKSMGLGEAYMDGWWDCPTLDAFFHKIASCSFKEKINHAKSIFSNTTESKHSAFHIGKFHYDLGNELFQHMLDKYLTYSCGYWKNLKTLDEAQEAKLDLTCKKLDLKKGMKVLDIGCGWGSFLKYAAEKYSVQTVGITVSKEQVKFAHEVCNGLPVEIRLQDYRDVDEKFDHIVSLGMFEHVGYKHYRTYMEVAHRLLKDNGLFLLHTIIRNDSKKTVDPWLTKYIFPGGMLPSILQIAASIEGLFVIEDLHNLGADYDKTLMAWYDNFSKNWDKIKSNYTDKFYRMWKYFLLSCAGTFRARQMQVCQIVLSKNGIVGGYQSIR